MTSPLWKELGALGTARKAGAVSYLVRDDFTTTAGGPLSSPRTCEPGPGSLTIVQTSGQFSISSDKLEFNANTGWGNLYARGDAQTRAAGLALLSTFQRTTGNNMIIGWHNSTTHPANITSFLYGASVGGTGAVSISSTSNASVQCATITSGTAYSLALVAQATGLLILIKGGAFTSWTLLWDYRHGSGATLYPYLTTFDIDGSSDYFRVRQLPAPFDSALGLATVNVSSPSSGTEYTGNADGMTDMTITAPGSLDGLDTTRCGFYYRADADLSPAWHCYLDGLGRFRLDSIAADGTRTNRISVNSVISAGQTHTIRVRRAGALHDCYSLVSTTWTKRGSQINVSLNDAVATIEPSIPAGWTAANLIDWPYTMSAAVDTELSRV